MEPVKSAPGLERKLVAILAADVVGFSSHMERDEVATLAALSKLRESSDKIIDNFSGRITSTAGDSVIAEFSSVLNAVEAAVNIQEQSFVDNHKAGVKHPLWFRIGLNVGDVMVKGSDIFGDGVNVASRLEGVSESGGISVSRGVFDYVDKQTAYVFDDLGMQKVKNISEPIDAYSIRFEDGKAVVNKEAFDAPVEKVVNDQTTSGGEALELSLWETVKDSESSAELQAYLNKFPDGTFSEVAKMRISDIESAK